MPPFNNQMFQGMPPQGVSQMGPGGGMNFGGFDPRMLQQYLASMQGQQAPFEQQGPGGMESMPQGAPMPPPGWGPGGFGQGIQTKPFQVQPSMSAPFEQQQPMNSFLPKPMLRPSGGPQFKPLPGTPPGGGMQGAPQGAPIPAPTPRMPPAPRLPPNAGVYKNPVAGMQNQTPVYSGQVRPPGPQRDEVTGGLMAPESSATATKPKPTTRPKEGGSPPFNPNGTISAQPAPPEPLTMGPSGSFAGSRDKMKAELRAQRVSAKR